MEWSDVRIFLAVARKGTLGGASRALQLSHPTVGRRVRALEASIGRPLFQRTTEGYVLTEEGSVMLSLAEQMEESALAMERRVTGDEHRLEGTLRISSADWFGAYVLPPVLQEYARDYPGVTTEVLTGTRLFNLAQREADIAFRIVPFEGPDIVHRRLMHMPYGVYVSADSPDPAREGAGSRLICMDMSTGTFADVEWLNERFPKARVAIRSNNRNVQARMCAAGIGIAVLPRPVGDRTGGIRLLDLGGAPPGRDIWLGYHRDLRRLGRLRAFVDIAVRCLAPTG